MSLSPQFPGVEDIRVIGIDFTKRGVDTKTASAVLSNVPDGEVLLGRDLVRISRLLGGERVTGAAAAFGPTNQDALFDQLQDVTESGVL